MPIEYELSDESVIEGLEELRNEFQSGHSDRLWHAIILCATQQAVMPDWIVDELLRIDDELRSGLTKDLNEAFKYKKLNVATRAKNYRMDKRFMQVMKLINAAKREGKGIGDALYEEIGESLQCSVRDVRDFYKCGKQIQAEVRNRRKGLETPDITDESWDELDPSLVTIARRRGRPTY